jgi:cytochrome c oxidase subunit 3
VATETTAHSAGTRASAHSAAAHSEAHGHDEHSILHHHFDDLAQQRECTSLGMWLFLATEVMMFGGLFFAYSLYRWRFYDAYLIGSGHLNIWLGTINTFVLLFSSLTMAMAVHSAQEGKKQPLFWYLIFTWLLGAAFIGIKAIEWGHDYHIGLIPALNWTWYDSHPVEESLLKAGLGPQQVLMYFVIYFSMTGLHAIHMVVGLLLVGYFIWLSQRGQFMKGNDQPVEILGLYWHLVDIIWIFLFPLLYLIAGFPILGKVGH